jgi:hypothetical protein
LKYKNNRIHDFHGEARCSNKFETAYDNQKDIIQIKERNPNLIDDTLQVYPIETFEEALQYSLI